MILWLFDILKTFISLIPLHITGVSPGECLISPCAVHRGRFRLLQEHSHLGFEERPSPPLPGPPPRIFPVPLTETKILSSVTYGCIINEKRICIILRTHDGVLCFPERGGWGGVHACMQTYTSPPTHTQPPMLYDQTCVWCCTRQSVRQYRKPHLASSFMSPLLLRYIVTANMKSGLFCQKCVNKHGNTSSEGHNSILHDKCSESAVVFRFSHKITEQTKVGCQRL